MCRGAQDIGHRAGGLRIQYRISPGFRGSKPTWGGAPGSALGLQLLDGGAHALRRGLAEGGDADVGQPLLRLLPLPLRLALAGCLPAGAQPANLLGSGVGAQGSMSGSHADGVVRQSDVGGLGLLPPSALAASLLAGAEPAAGASQGMGELGGMRSRPGAAACYAAAGFDRQR